jgi:transposase-like protein
MTEERNRIIYRQTGMTYDAIADEHDLDRSTIQRICRQHNYEILEPLRVAAHELVKTADLPTLVSVVGELIRARDALLPK